jgi:hypothetical protein
MVCSEVEMYQRIDETASQPAASSPRQHVKYSEASYQTTPHISEDTVTTVRISNLDVKKCEILHSQQVNLRFRYLVESPYGAVFINMSKQMREFTMLFWKL